MQLQPQQQECATFTLRTCDLPTYASGPNDKGSRNNDSNSSCTWNNIDLRSILGQMYDKYEYFNISLVSSVVSSGTMSYVNNDNTNRIGIIYMKGLNWINAGYDIGTKSFTGNAPIGSINLTNVSSTAGVSQQYNTLYFNTFSKANPIVTLTIFYNKISDNTLITTTPNIPIPNTSFIFKIYGVKLDNPVNNHLIVGEHQKLNR